jgi:hypothetical protein
MQEGIIKPDGKGGYFFEFKSEPQGENVWVNEIPITPSQAHSAWEMQGLTVKAEITPEGYAHIKQIVT